MGVMCSFRALQLLTRLGHLPPGHWLDRLQNRYDTPDRSLANSYSWTLVLGGRFRLALFCDTPDDPRYQELRRELLEIREADTKTVQKAAAFAALRERITSHVAIQ